MCHRFVVSLLTGGKAGFIHAVIDVVVDPAVQLINLLYLHADPHYTGRVTVPVLWDKKQQTIVSNESAEAC
jgi:glutathionyl-hydroquinone reductase